MKALFVLATPGTAGVSPARFCVFLYLMTVFSAFPASPAMRVVRGSPSAMELVSNGNFENSPGGKPQGWAAAPKGFVLGIAEGRSGSVGLRCQSAEDRGWYGASQTITLSQAVATPLVVRGWSKASDVNGSSDSDYSLYVDLLYADGTPWWGQTGNFQCGTHDWERREIRILPERPVKSLTLHCLFRNHSGVVWFDDLSVTEVRTEGKTVLFQGVAVIPTNSPTTPLAHETKAASRWATQDGLGLVMRDNAVDSLSIAGQELATDGPSGFLVRDCLADSDFYAFQQGSCPELGLKLRLRILSQTNHITIEGRLSDTRGRDRAVTLVFAVPINALGWSWGDDVRHSRLISGSGEFSKLVSTKCGATGNMSLYPLAAVSGEHAGLALAIDMAKPAQYRLGYHAGTQQLFIAYDFGLVPETERFPSGADFRFVLYRFNPRWGFRAAFQKLIEIFPDYFQVRSHDQGLWMPFTDIATVQDAADFGFKYHEGNNNIAWDDAHGVLSFRYTEPMTWWMRMPPEMPRTAMQAVRRRDELAVEPKNAERKFARVCRAAGMSDESGQPALLFRNEPWCNGAVWSLNPNPNLPAQLEARQDEKSAADQPGFNAATVHWNPTIRESLYGPTAKAQLDGEYLDSLEGYVTAELNFRRDHFRYSTVPLTFAPETKQPALFKGLAVFEFTRWISEEVHHLGKLTFANGVPYRFTFLCPWLDVLGTETDWVREGKYEPAKDEQMCLWRTMSGAKPYLLLMNTDYNVFTPSMVERYFQRCLFYGIYPGMFSHNAAENPYWQNPRWYNRDRPLFKRYIPLIKRIAEAGWQPVTGVSCANPRIFLERFGPNAAGEVFLTVFNDTSSPQSGRLEIDFSGLGFNGSATLGDLLSGKPLDFSPDILVAPDETKIIVIAHPH